MPTISDAEELLIEAPGQGVVVDDERDQRLIPNEAWADASNVRFYAKTTKVRKTDSVDLFDTTPSSERIRQLMRHYGLDGVQQLVRVTLSKVYKSFGGTRTDITGTALTGTADDIVTWDQYENLLFFTDLKDRPQRWDGVAATFVNAGGLAATFRAQIVRSFKNHLLWFNTVEAGNTTPWRMVYSATGTPEVYTGATTGNLDLVTTPGEVVAAEVHEDAVLAFKPKAVHRINFVGLPDNFIQEVVSAEDGCLSPRGAIKIGPYVYYVGNYGFYRLAQYPERISDAIFSLWLSKIDLSKKKHIFAYHRPNFKEVVWRSYRIGDSQPTFELAYNYEEGTWAPRDCDPGTSYVSAAFASGDDSWDGGSSASWDSQTLTWDASGLSSGAERELYSQANGNIQQYRGLNSIASGACTAFVESKIFHIGTQHPSRLIRIPLVAKGTGTLRVMGRAWDDERQTPPAYTELAQFSLSSNRRPYVDCRMWGRLMQLRFENMNPADDWQLEMYGLKYLPSGGVR